MNTIIISISVKGELLKRIDKHRGDVKRSTYISKILDKVVPDGDNKESNE